MRPRDHQVSRWAALPAVVHCSISPLMTHGRAASRASATHDARVGSILCLPTCRYRKRRRLQQTVAGRGVEWVRAQGGRACRMWPVGAKQSTHMHVRACQSHRYVASLISSQSLSRRPITPFHPPPPPPPPPPPTAPPRAPPSPSYGLLYPPCLQQSPATVPCSAVSARSFMRKSYKVQSEPIRAVG